MFRYIAYDASPQRGVEIFADVERIIYVDAFGANAAVRDRRLPLATLGHGRCSLLDKVQAHIHQTWLDYGPTMRSLTRANRAARQCLADQGTEFGIADVADVTHECAYSTRRCLARSTFWIPFSQDALERLCWWHAWESEAKSVCQRLRNKLHRDFFMYRLAWQAKRLTWSVL